MRNGRSTSPVQLRLNPCAVSLKSDTNDTRIFFPRPCTFNALKFPQCLKRRKQQGSISSIYVKDFFENQTFNVVVLQEL